MRVAAVTVRQLSKDSLLYELALDLRAEEPPDAGTTGTSLISCINTSPSGSFYPLGGEIVMPFGGLPNPSDGNTYYLRPGISYPIEPTIGHQGAWHFPRWSAGGVGTTDYVGMSTQGRVRCMVRGNGTMTIHTAGPISGGGTPYLQAILMHHQYGAGEEGNPQSGVDFIDSVQSDITGGDDIVVEVSTHNGQNCTHWVDVRDQYGVDTPSSWGYSGFDWELSE